LKRKKLEVRGGGLIGRGGRVRPVAKPEIMVVAIRETAYEKLSVQCFRLE
jgi:hypothetical protein